MPAELAAGGVLPIVMRDYREAYDSFSIDALEREILTGSLCSGLNACIECCDRWAGENRVALHWTRQDFTCEDITFTRASSTSTCDMPRHCSGER